MNTIEQRTYRYTVADVAADQNASVICPAAASGAFGAFRRFSNLATEAGGAM